MGASSKILKYTYLGVKCAAAGTPATYVCVKFTKMCFRDIVKEDLPSTACKIALATCAPVGVTVAAGAFCNPIQMRKLQRGAKAAVKFAKLVYTGPAAGLDTCFAPLEEAWFGESLPLV